MSAPTDFGDLIVASVEPLLDRLYADAAVLPPERRHEVAMNVLLNATLSALEVVRKEAPQEHRIDLKLAVAMLSDD